jgi:serpin B
VALQWSRLFSRQGSDAAVQEARKAPATTFEFELLRRLREFNRGNVFLSPASVTVCLQMVMAGATGETRTEMEHVIQTSAEDPSAVAAAIASLVDDPNISPSLQLEMANALWCAQQVPLSQAYLKRVQDLFAAEISNLNFADPGAPDIINRWVSAKTHGKIPSIVDQFGPLFVLAAANAIYFKDDWADQFQKLQTRPGVFDLATGQKKEAMLMSRYGKYPYYENSEFQAVRLGFKTSRLAMYVFLPSVGSSLAALVANLDKQECLGWIRKLERMEGSVFLPRFKFESTYELRPILTQMGMGIAFSQQARFDNICVPPPPVWIDSVRHRAFVEVNEEGAEAAAVTISMMTGSSRSLPSLKSPFFMMVNRPFFFVIRDDQTDTILFMGAVEDPTQ